MNELLQLLSHLNIKYHKFDHPAVFSTAESEEKCPPMPGAHTKQLLLRDKKKQLMLLAIVMHDKRVDTRALAKEFSVQSFSFASPELLLELLHVTPGSVTPFGLMFDTDHRIKLIIDEDAWNTGQFLFHPLVNTATLSIDKVGFEKFLMHTGHAIEVRKIPVRVDNADQSAE